ncbi:MAG: tyrosine-type recombinase/integrase [Amphiplicatus sp.]
MRKRCDENERLKRQYLEWLTDAEGFSEQSVDKAAAALARFEDSTGGKPFRAFHIDQAKAFKRTLAKTKTANGRPLSKATISATVRAVKAFFKWLSQRPGFRSRISLADCEYFNLAAKDEAIAHAHREVPFPSMEQALHAFRAMPDRTDIEKRNKAISAFLILTGARVSAAASLRLAHVDLVEGQVFQDAREVKTKASKTIYTTLFPVADDVRACFDSWVRHLKEALLFGPADPLFPRSKVSLGGAGKFAVARLDRTHWATAAPIRQIVGDSFEAAGLPRFGPHAFRKTLEQWGATRYVTPEAFKAFSQNLGHESVLTTFTSYGQVSRQRQAEIIRSIPGQ